jgi:dTDP-4-dehydrorhamnose reductase
VRPFLVIGRKGQVATDLVAAGQRAGVSLTALGRPDLDLTNPASIALGLDQANPAAVINAAAYTAVDRAESEPDLAFAVNRDGPAALGAALRRRAHPAHSPLDRPGVRWPQGGRLRGNRPA